jgi:hypothetical protein
VDITLLTPLETRQRLKASQSMLWKVKPHLPALLLPNDMRRYPYDYITALADYLKKHKQTATKITVFEFGATDAAQDLIVDVQRQWKETLAGGRIFTAYELADLLRIGRMTITDWERAGSLTVRRKDSTGKRGSQETLHITSAEVRRTSTWYIPKL